MAFNSYDGEIKSPGYPDDYKKNSTCEYHIDVFDEDNVVHIGFQELSFGPNDVFTMYDAARNKTVLGPLIGPQDAIRIIPTNSASVRIVVRSVVSLSDKQRYFISFKEVPKGDHSSYRSLHRVGASCLPYFALLNFINTPLPYLKLSNLSLGSGHKVFSRAEKLYDNILCFIKHAMQCIHTCMIVHAYIKNLYPFPTTLCPGIKLKMTLPCLT